MVLFNLMKGVEFSKEEYKLFEILCNAYLKYDAKTASFLLSVMPSDPNKTGGRFSAEGLTLKWFDTDDESGINGAFNPLWPSTFFLHSSSTKDCFSETCENVSKEKSLRLKREKLEQSLNWILLMFPTIMHELYHMFQWKTSKVGYIAMRFVTVFTSIPYYMFQNAEWMTKLRKYFAWDLEGQAEENGDKAPHVDEFVDEITQAVTALQFDRRGRENYVTRINKCKEEEKAEIEEMYESNMLQSKNMFDACTAFSLSWGRQLTDVIDEYMKEA